MAFFTRREFGNQQNSQSSSTNFNRGRGRRQYNSKRGARYTNSKDHVHGNVYSEANQNPQSMSDISTINNSSVENVLDPLPSISEDVRPTVISPLVQMNIENNEKSVTSEMMSVEESQTCLNPQQKNSEDEYRWSSHEHYQMVKAARKRAGLPIKVDKKLKKRRLNMRLERVLKPKNAFLIFNELNLKPEFKIHENIGICGTKLFVAILTLDGRIYKGEAYSVAGAKMIAADLALKDLFSRMVKKTEAQLCESTALEVDSDARTPDSEPVPWSAFGSYAMHLLFTRWNISTIPICSAPVSRSSSISPDSSNEVASLPVIKSTVPQGPTISAALKNYPTPDKEKIPAVAEVSQALYFFNLACPKIPVVENINMNSIEERFELQCQVEGVIYKAAARNKKECKRQLASQVLRNFGVNFVSPPLQPEIKGESVEANVFLNHDLPSQ